MLSTPKSGQPKFKVGDGVFGASQGAFATKICAKEADLQPIPKKWNFREASALYLTGPTSYAALIVRAGLQAGEWCLVHGAAGGVGLAAIQVAKAVGARVIATATTERNINVCKSYGADFTIDYIKTPNWETEVMKITDGHGADVVFDPVGTISQSMKCAAFSGRLVTIGFVGGQIESIKINRVLLKNVSVVGLHWGAYVHHDPQMIPKVWAGLFKFIEQGKFRATVFQSQDGNLSGLENVGRALKILEDKASWGKVVVDVTDGEVSKL